MTESQTRNRMTTLRRKKGVDKCTQFTVNISYLISDIIKWLFVLYSNAYCSLTAISRKKPLKICFL